MIPPAPAGRARPAIRFGIPIVRVGECGSTNDLARILAASGAPEGAVVVADRQTRGRGRQGRAWISPDGGLWCSVLLRPGAAAPRGLLSLAAAVAVAESVEQAAPAQAAIRAAIRWPNDVEVAGRKVAGVLLEGSGEAVVAGIGINVDVDLTALPGHVAACAGSLHLIAGRPIGRRVVLDALLAALARWYQAWAAGGGEVLEAWASRDALRGRRVVVRRPGGVLEGAAEGVDADGALLLRLAGGGAARVVAGDVERVEAARWPGTAAGPGTVGGPEA